FPDRRPVPAADAQARRACPLLDTGGIRGAGRACPRQRLPDGFGVAADAFELSRRRRFRPTARGARRSTQDLTVVAITRHAERKVVPFAPRQIFDLVADVPRYPEFLPWCTAARVRRKEGPNDEIDELAIGFGPLHEQFVSRVTKNP